MNTVRIKLGYKVQLQGKDVIGKWVGVILNEPKGKNNGVVQGKRYFTCDDNHETSSMNTSMTAAEPSPSARRVSNARGNKFGTRDHSPAVSVRSDKSVDVNKNLPDVSLLSTSNVHDDSQLSNTTESDSVEIKNLKAENHDLTEKLSTLVAKRSEDKVKLKEMEKLKIQVAQTDENRRLLQEKVAELQREITSCKKEKLELQQTYDHYREEMSEVHETIELAALDKEMAEAKFDEAKSELDLMKEQLEELKLENEIFKAEQQARGELVGGPSGDKEVTNSVHYKQLEQQNERLREALVKMRDLSNQDKYEISHLTKEVTSLRTESVKLQEQNEHLADSLKEAEERAIELNEQADAALGADQMVTSLSQKVMELEDKLQQITDERNDLEDLCQLNDELQENARETEREIREELDQVRMQCVSYARYIDASKSEIADYEHTFSKFRDVISDLQTKNESLQRTLKGGEAGSDSINESVITSDTSKLLTRQLSKSSDKHAVGKLIEMELRRMKAEQGAKHVGLLSEFLPQSFVRRNGDHDSIKMMLLIDRLIFKCELLTTQVRERNPLPSCIPGQANTMASILAAENKSGLEAEDLAGPPLSKTKAEYFGFCTSICLMLNEWRHLLEYLKAILETCTPEYYMQLTAGYLELCSHEASMDNLIELAKRDQLDENASLEVLIASIRHFINLHTTTLKSYEGPGGNKSVPECSVVMANFARVALSAADALCTNAFALSIMSGENTSELNAANDTANATSQSGLDSIESIESLIAAAPDQGLSPLLCELVRLAGILRNRARSIRRRLPTDSNTQPLQFGPSVSEQMDKACNDLFSLIRSLASALRHAGQLTAQRLTEDDLTIKPSSGLGQRVVMEECLVPAVSSESSSSAQLTSSNVDARVKDLLSKAVRIVHSIAIHMEHGEYDFDGTKDAKMVPPTKARADAYKQAQAELENCRSKLEMKEAELKELQLQLKMKANELSEYSARVKNVEKKLELATHGNDGKVASLEERLNQALDKLAESEKNHEMTFGELQSNYEELEKERNQYKEKLQSIGKKNFMEHLENPASISGVSSGNMDTFKHPSSMPASKDTAYYVKELSALKEINTSLMQSNSHLSGMNMRERLTRMKPLNVPKVKSLATKTQAENDMKKRCDLIQSQLLTLLANPVVVKPVGSKERGQLSTTCLINRYNMKLVQLRTEVDKLQKDVVSHIEKLEPNRRVRSDFALFPSRRFVKQWNSNNDTTKFDPKDLVCKIKLPKDMCKDSVMPDLADPNGIVRMRLPRAKINELKYSVLAV